MTKTKTKTTKGVKPVKAWALKNINDGFLYWGNLYPSKKIAEVDKELQKLTHCKIIRVEIREC